MSKRMCFALDLKDDPEVIRQYEAYHQQVWPEVLASIKDAGVEDMQIYRTGNRLFMVMEVNGTFDPEIKAKKDIENPKIQEWEKLMSTMQQELPWAEFGEKWTPMHLTFQLK